MAHLSISLLGTLRITLDGKPVTDFATDKVRALLAYLAVEADRPHRRDTLAGLLWPDQPQERARQSLRQALSDLRKVIGDCDDAPFLLVSREAIQFNADCDHWLDVAAFADLAKICKTHRHRRLAACLPCIRRMERMVDLYQGPFLEQFFLVDSTGFEEWAVLRREWLQREVAEALFYLATHCERRGEYKQAQQVARRQVQMEPWREEAHRQLMRLLALDGQRSAALAQYEVCRRALADELGIEPTAETKAVYEQIQEGEAGGEVWEYGSGGEHPHTPTLNFFPSFTSFVGREVELGEIADILANPDCRLVTLFGPGGIGKTRLALQVAADHLGTFEEGVAFVPLAHIGAVEHFVPAVASALGLSFHGDQDPEEQLLDYLRQKELLLVLDNLEHIVGCASFLSAVLRRAPGVVLLVTSRERLNMHEEWVYEIAGLAYPRGEVVDVEDDYSALALFRQRACQVDRHFSLSQAEVGHAIRICQLVEGMPLGIELAASWVSVQSCEEIAGQIASSLDILTTRLSNVPERHRSLWATFEHSFQLLAEEEKKAFAGLAIFRGGFSREAAAAVTGVSFSLLTALQDKSLIRRTSPDRYDMHEMLRQYALEKLQGDSQVYEEMQAHHARYFAAFLAQRENLLQGEEQRRALEEIAVEIENAHCAWQVALARGWAEQIAQSLEGLYHFYNIRCRFKEGAALFALAADRWAEMPERADLFGRALAYQGALCHRLGRYDQAQDLLEQSLGIFERLGAYTRQAFCLITLAELNRNLGKYDAAEGLAQKSLDLSRQCGDRCGVASALYTLGMLRYRTGQVEQAKALLEESLAVSQECGNRHVAMSALNALGDVTCHLGAYDEAWLLFESCLQLGRDLDDQYTIATLLNNLGTILHVLEKYEEARSYYQESLDIRRQIGDQSGQAISLTNLGELAHVLCSYDEALTYYQEALAIGRRTRDQWVTLNSLNNLGEMACTLDGWAGAKAYLTEALATAYETRTLTLLSKTLVNLAVFFAKQGQDDRAAALLGLVGRHPASERDTKEKAKRLLDELGLTSPDALPESLEAVAAEVLAELST
ncbi:MAG: tetratricopeptide repeat protein [Anaerolineae bacterium]|nr:tetratricopeptide repeat protein [Anaerolineae bacterium]